MTSYTPPKYTIDLSLPPRQRYKQLASQYSDQIQNLTALFNNLLEDVAIPTRFIPTIHRLAKLTLRKVHSPVETEELRGISEITGVPMYLLVAFNVILDLLMGCTSGVIKTKYSDSTRMLHFRTLDWSMDPLRKVIVQLEFIESSKSDNVIATSITYVGFTGVLTGVRPGLSMSLNFRAVHDESTKRGQLRFYLHHLLVLFGQRQPIATYLRGCLFNTKTLTEVRDELWKTRSTAAYLVFSDGNSAISIDKDFESITIRESTDFLATTNHDVEDHTTPLTTRAVHMKELLDESEDRLKCIVDRWERWKKRTKVNDPAVSQRQIIDWMSKYPTTNECTHFACVMDPTDGTILWSRAYSEPLEQGDSMTL